MDFDSTPLYWKTQKGEKILITEMSDEHLKNAMDFLWNKRDKNIKTLPLWAILANERARRNGGDWNEPS